MWPFTKKRTEIKSVSLPELTPRWNLHGMSQRDWNFDKAILEGYNASGIVFAAIEKRAKSIASVPLLAQRKKNGSWEWEPDSQLQALIDRPNPDMDTWELLYRISQHLDIMGNAFMTEIKGGVQELPIALWPVNPGKVKIKPGTVELIKEYIYGIEKRVILPEDMVHIKLPSPDSPYFGQPVLRGAAKPTDIDREAGNWQKVSLENRGASDIHVKLPENATDTQVKQIEAEYKKLQSGPPNARKALITTGDVIQLNQTAIEMDFVNSRKANWTEIAAVFGTPLAVLGFTEDVNLANAKTMRQLFWQDTIVPQLLLICRQLTHQLAQEFGPEWRVYPDLSVVEALQEDLDKKLENAKRLWGLGVPLNAINDFLELGLDDQEGGDVGYVPTGVLPVGWEASLQADSGATGDDPENNPGVDASPLSEPQVARLITLVTSVVRGEIPRDSALAIAKIVFPNLDESQLNTIFQSLESVKDSEEVKSFLKALGYGT